MNKDVNVISVCCAGYYDIFRPTGYAIHWHGRHVGADCSREACQCKVFGLCLAYLQMKIIHCCPITLLQQNKYAAVFRLGHSWK